jgi:molybdopterin-guanine dinucleotide biosynthesis protein A
MAGKEIYVGTAAIIGCPTSQRRENVYHRPMDRFTSPVTAFILAGGRSTRMGTDKAFVLLDGRTLLARALDLPRSLTSDVRIVGDPAKFASFATVVEDQFPGCGPLAGIHAALRSSQTDLNLMLAVDMPFLTPALLHHMLGRAKDSGSAMVTVPRTSQGWQPLCAVYHRDFASIAEKALRAGRYKIDALFTDASLQVIGEPELKSAGFSLDLFSNLNTADDLAEAAYKPH